jgi:hypothetical protein
VSGRDSIMVDIIWFVVVVVVVEDVVVEVF